MSLIGTGQGLRRKAQQGMEAVARLENQRNMQQSALDAQAKAQEMQLYGTGMGIGGAYGVNKALAAKGAAGVGQMSSVAAPVSQTTASLGTAVPGVNAAATGQAGAALSSAVPGAQAAAGGGLAASGTGAAAAGSSAAAGTGAAAAGSTAAAGTGAAAAGGASTGAMAALGTIAAPLAIGLGAAFLLNKLFG